MNFVQTSPTTWESADGEYLVRFTSEVLGVSVRPHYHALVKTDMGGRPGWWFAGRRGPYFALNAATKACDRHEKVWQRIVKILHSERKGRQDRLAAVNVKSVVGKGVTAQRLTTAVPSWVVKSVEAKVLARLSGPRRKQVTDEE